MIRASSMNRVMKCGASWPLQQHYPNDSNDAANEGTLAHEWAAYKLKGGDALPDDSEMQRHVSDYVNFCRSLSDHALTGIEEKHDDGHVSGTTDFFTWTPYELVITDFKYGYGWVDVNENWQLITYAVLMWLKHGNNGQVIPPKVRLIVVQPRANHPDGPVRQWEFPGEQLRGYYNQIRNRVSEIEVGTATAVPGKHCRYCRAIVDCKANRQYASYIMDFAYRAERTDMTPAQLAYDLNITQDAFDMLKHRLTALEVRVEEVIKAGELVPGYILTQKTSALSWDVPDPVAAALEFGADISKPLEPITPTQAVSRGLLPEDIVNIMASRKPGGFVLKRQNLDHVKRIINNE